MFDLAVSALAAFTIALIGSVVIVATRKLHGRLTHDHHDGVQKVHRLRTPRIGGLALLGGGASAAFFLPEEAAGLWLILLAAGLPAFASGLLEDLTRSIKPRWRLAATIGSGLTFALASGYLISRVGIPGADWLLAWPLFAIAFTAFAIGGIANAMNLIDGFNGLASGTALVIFVTYGIVAWTVGDMALLGAIVVATAALLGFFLVNFPRGFLFLGDCGAYHIGFLLAAFSVALPARNPEVSPIIGLLALSYPVIETLISIYRRVRREGHSPGQPDRLHLHSLVHRRLARPLARRLGAPDLENPLTAVLIWPLPVFSAACVLFGNAVQPAIPVLIGLMVYVYLRVYRRLALLAPAAPSRAPRGEAAKSRPLAASADASL